MPGSGAAGTCRSRPLRRTMGPGMRRWPPVASWGRRRGAAALPDEVAARCASPSFRAGAFYPDSATVQPARLALDLRERLLAAGIEIYERSPVRRLPPRRTLAPPKVPRALCGGRGGREDRRRHGSRRRRLVAIGGAAKAPRAPLRDALTVTSSHIVLTEPVPELLEEIGWTGGECITDGRTLIDYFRTTPDGRIAFGWGGPDRDGRAAAWPRRGRPRGRRRPPRPASTSTSPALPGGASPMPGAAPSTSPPPTSRSSCPCAAPRLRRRRLHRQRRRPLHMVARTLASLALDRRDDHSRLPIVDPAPRRVPPSPSTGWEASRSAAPW